MEQWRKDRAMAFLRALESILDGDPDYYGYVGNTTNEELIIDGAVSWKNIDAALSAIDPKTPSQVAD